MNRSRKGFTLIELIVAMSIILILGTITVVGVRSMMQSSRAASTRVLLQSADSLYDEWRRAAGLNGRTPSQAWPETILPISLNADDPSNYRVDKAVRLTRGMMFRMSQVPAIRKTIQALPADRLWTFPAHQGVNPDPLLRSADYYIDVDTFAYSAAASAQLNDKTVRECIQTGRFYISSYEQQSTDYPAAPAPGTATGPAFWLETSHKTTILVDTWNNPLLFVPTCGFIVGTELHTSHGVTPIIASGVYWSSSATYSQGDFVTFAGADGVWGLYRYSNPTATSGNRPDAGSGYWDQIPTRPFFASAGPDGVFYDPANPETLQDNLYSYER